MVNKVEYIKKTKLEQWQLCNVTIPNYWKEPILQSTHYEFLYEFVFVVFVDKKT